MAAAAWLPCDGRRADHKCQRGASYQGSLHGSHIPDWLEKLITEGWQIGHKIAFCPRCSQERGLGRHFKNKARFRELTGDELL